MDGFEVGWGILVSTDGVPARSPTVFPNAQKKSNIFNVFITIKTSI